ncbi:MAG: T9SS type A sorting domain-containing protein [Candidatus Cloacimonetes bacterium]|nr:T9SS type A sorting domain-containing protein [Candidatus Cloacimonadota bacterium]MBL7149042.1 T9SS type A sorting domain-containing protein [Candidatus Cloacimonadota bacterium]
MKRVLILLILSLFICTLLANDFMQPAQIAKSDYYQGMRFGRRSAFRDQDPPPEYSFIQNGDCEDTTYLIDSYYDYMPFSYNGHNLRLQPETSMPYGYPADGIFVTYMCSETSALMTDRRAFYSYLNPDGTLYYSGAINVYPPIRHEGYTSCAIDPVTGDPFAVWHARVEPDNTFDCLMSYELFHASGSSGNWIEPFILFDNPEMSQPYTGASNDAFLWPQVWVGPSPLAGHRRVHAYANNAVPNSAIHHNYNSLYGYADFNADSLLFSSHLDWTVQSLSYFDYMHYNDIDRVNKDLIVSEVDGKVAFFGSAGDSLFAMYSDDYGDTFTKYTQQLKQPMDNPTNQNPPYDPVWTNDDGSAAEMFILPSNDLSHFNGVFTDNHTKVQWMSGVNYNSAENIAQDVYWPAYIYPKIFTFDINTGEFSFYDLDVQDTDPGDDHLAVAFDLNDDGIVDEYDDEGWPIVVMSCPSWFFNTEGGWQEAYFHESNCKMVSNWDWVVCVWHDSSKLQAAFYEEPGYDGWVKESEICIVISDDNGATWSDIRYINANPNDNVIDPVNHYDGNYAPELEDMIPVDVSLGDKLEILSNTPGNYHAKLHFVFNDDNDYGSAAGSTTNSGLLNGGSLRYAAIDLEFQPTSSADDMTVTPAACHLSQNYPNPFNPSTTIAYNITEPGKVSIEVFNIKGQKVKTLVNDHMTAGNHNVTWDGKDANNKSVSSGIYFYKLIAGRSEKVKKMILLK